MKNVFRFILLTLVFTSCMKWEYDDNVTDFDVSGKGLFIVCEGNFQYGNATLSYYNPASGEVMNEVFYRANGMRLGDVANSMTIYDNKGWIVVNNSHVVFAIDPDTFREVGRIENLTSPRYIHFVSDTKAYVTQLWDNRIFIVNPKTYSVTGFIEVPGMNAESGSTEQMVQRGKYVYCNCWSYQNRVIKIDTETDSVVGDVTVGLQPNSLVLDRNNDIWILTDGGFEGSPAGTENPALYCIDPDDLEIIKYIPLKRNEVVSSLTVNSVGDRLYWINGDVWSLSIDASDPPAIPIIKREPGNRFYSLSLSPQNDDIYVGDAIDYMQEGVVFRYSSDGFLLSQFYTGVTPTAFCWK